jgi:lipopolysaccharide/colanic/teichoic acid biosynthesis glycosyltransferase
MPVLLIMAVCAAAIWIQDGRPILFTQWRTGRGGRRFKMYKFRTMVKNAEQIKQQYLHLNKMSGPEFKLVDDPRVTRLGRFLRKCSLDELPQIFNVLKGEMSLVGPRPTSFEAAKYDLWQTERLEVLPGITGLAQVSGRSELSFEKKLDRDIAYVECRSFWLDLRILARTVMVLFNSRGAC